MTKAIAHTYTTFYGYRRQISLALMAASMVCALIYAANLYRVISHTLALRQVTAQTAILDTAISKLDTQYISISHTITPESLSARGFEQGKVSAFISRTASLGRIALAGHEL